MKWNLNFASRAGLVIFIAVSSLAFSESQHNGGGSDSSGRSSITSQTDSGFSVGACFPGRAEDFININPVKPIAATTERKVASPKTDFDVEECIKNLPQPAEKNDRGLQTIGWCIAVSLDGGKEPLEEPIVVEYPSISSMDPVLVKREACEQKIDPDRLKANDIECSATRPAEVR